MSTFLTWLLCATQRVRRGPGISIRVRGSFGDDSNFRARSRPASGKFLPRQCSLFYRGNGSRFTMNRRCFSLNSAKRPFHAQNRHWRRCFPKFVADGQLLFTTIYRCSIVLRVLVFPKRAHPQTSQRVKLIPLPSFCFHTSSQNVSPRAAWLPFSFRLLKTYSFVGHRSKLCKRENLWQPSFGGGRWTPHYLRGVETFRTVWGRQGTADKNKAAVISENNAV